MKTTQNLFKSLLIIIAITFGLISCEHIEVETPNATEFKNIQEEAIENITQSFTLTANNGYTTVTTASGAMISINTTSLKKNGSAVNGNIDLEVIEIFDKGTMVVTNKATMGLMNNGKKALLISGGEFYINATQDGIALSNNSNIYVSVPTTNADTDMKLFIGDDTDDDIVWEQATDTLANDTIQSDSLRNNMQVYNNMYSITSSKFGWINIDRFYSDPRSKTSIKVEVPKGFKENNCAVYISFDGFGTKSIAKLDIYENGYFSEYYKQLPIGLECHIIFVTESKGQWKWAIKPVTIAENQIYTISETETQTGNEEQIKSVINAIP